MSADELPELEPEDHAMIAAVRGLDRGGAPDWAALEARIQAATTRAPRRRRVWVAGAIGAAALAAGLAIWLARPRGEIVDAIRSVRAPEAAPAAIEPAVPAPIEDGEESLATADDLDGDLGEDDLGGDLGGGDTDLGAMPAVDDALVERVLALEAEADAVAGEADDLPAIGAAWTAVLDDLSEDDLDQALRWLDEQEAG